MLKITARTRVSELQASPPAVLRMLMSTGIYREGDDPEVMLGQLCWNFGFNPGILLTMLESVNVPEEVPPVDPRPFQEMPLLDLVEHIEQMHHAYLRENLPRLTALTGAVAASAPGDEALADLDAEMRSIAAELDTHLQHEEESLFPMVRDLVNKNGAITPTRCGSAVGGPIACMESEHEMATQTLLRMRELTNGYVAPAGAGAERHEMLESLARFDRDLVEHMYKENKVLFPRALEMQSGTRNAATG